MAQRKSRSSLQRGNLRRGKALDLRDAQRGHFRGGKIVDQSRRNHLAERGGGGDIDTTRRIRFGIGISLQKSGDFPELAADFLSRLKCVSMN